MVRPFEGGAVSLIHFIHLLEAIMGLVLAPGMAIAGQSDRLQIQRTGEGAFERNP
jgi:hypothetical protein